MCIYIYMYMHELSLLLLYIYIYIYIYMYVCIIYLDLYLSLSIYIYIYVILYSRIVMYIGAREREPGPTPPLAREGSEGPAVRPELGIPTSMLCHIILFYVTLYYMILYYTLIPVGDNRHRLNRYLAQRVPSLFLASIFAKCFNRVSLED